MPDVVAATEPRVSLKSPKKTHVKSKKSQSALDLITKSRVGEVISVIPISTKIWVQVGAFHAETSANSVLKRIKSIGDGEVSQVNVLGKTFFRVRLGPVEDVAAADQLLHRVVNTGFSGARIIVD